MATPYFVRRYTAHECGWVRIGTTERGDVWEMPDGRQQVFEKGKVPSIGKLTRPRDFLNDYEGES